MGLTYTEIAEKYRRSVGTITKSWAKHPQWPPVAGKRGRSLLFDAEAVDAFARAHFLPPPPPEGDRRELLTLAEIANRTGQPLDTLNGYAYRGDPRLWPEPVHRQGVQYWVWGEVSDHLAARRRKPTNR